MTSTDKGGLLFSPEELAERALASAYVIKMARALPAGDDQYLDKLYHYGFGIIPGSVVEAVYSAGKKHPSLSDGELSALLLADKERMARLTENLRWEYSNADMAERLRKFERLITVDGRMKPGERLPADSPFKPPEEIVCFVLSARAMSGAFEHVSYKNGLLAYERGGPVAKPLKKTVPLAGKSLYALCEALAACHVENWPSWDDGRPRPIGSSFPTIELQYRDGTVVNWENLAPPKQRSEALALVTAGVSSALELDFDMDGYKFIQRRRPQPSPEAPSKPEPPPKKPPNPRPAPAFAPDEAEAEHFLRGLGKPGVGSTVFIIGAAGLGAPVLTVGLALNIAALAISGIVLLCAGLVAALFVFSRWFRLRRCLGRLNELGLYREAAAQLMAAEPLKHGFRFKENPCVYTADFVYVPSCGTMLSLSDIKELHITGRSAGKGTAAINVTTFSGMRAPMGAADAAKLQKALAGRKHPPTKGV